MLGIILCHWIVNFFVNSRKKPKLLLQTPTDPRVQPTTKFNKRISSNLKPKKRFLDSHENEQRNPRATTSQTPGPKRYLPTIDKFVRKQVPTKQFFRKTNFPRFWHQFGEALLVLSYNESVRNSDEILLLFNSIVNNSSVNINPVILSRLAICACLRLNCKFLAQNSHFRAKFLDLNY